MSQLGCPFAISVVKGIFLDLLCKLPSFYIEVKTEVNSGVEIQGSSFYMEVICVAVIFYTFSICFIQHERGPHFFLMKVLNHF